MQGGVSRFFLWNRDAHIHLICLSSGSAAADAEQCSSVVHMCRMNKKGEMVLLARTSLIEQRCMTDCQLSASHEAIEWHKFSFHV